MSQQRLHDMISNIEKRQDERHEEVLRSIGEIRTDFRTHMTDDKAEHNRLQGQFNKIYTATIGALMGAMAWVFK